jgi:hypothetical protein
MQKNDSPMAKERSAPPPKVMLMDGSLTVMLRGVRLPRENLGVAPRLMACRRFARVG